MSVIVSLEELAEAQLDVELDSTHGRVSSQTTSIFDTHYTCIHLINNL